MLDYLHNVQIRIRITAVFMSLFVAIPIAIVAFPIVYWLLGISPESIADWAIDKQRNLLSQMR